LAGLVSSCKKDDNPVASNGDELVGVWVLTKIIVPAYNNAELTPDDVGVHATFDLKSDRTFKVTMTDSSGTSIETGTWSTANGKVTLKGESETEEMPYTVSGNKLMVETTYTIEPFGAVAVKLELTKQ
jgi:hypothetical protein